MPTQHQLIPSHAISHTTNIVIHNYYKLFLLIVSSVCYAARRREIFDIKELREKVQLLGSAKLQDIFIGK